MRKSSKIYIRNVIASEAGLSLIEILIGSAIMVSLGFSAFYANTVKNLNNGTAATRFRCESATQSELAFFQGQGIVSSVNTFIVADTSRNAPNSLFAAPGIDINDLWRTDTPAVVSDSPVPVLSNAILIGGAIRNLAAIYNTDPAGFCGPGKTYGPLKQFLHDNLSMPEDLDTNIKIEPYNLATGAPEACGTLPTPLFLAPRGRDAASLATDPSNSMAAANPKVRSDLGFKLTIKTKFTDKDQRNVSQNYFCSVSQRFQYQRDVMSPLMINAQTLDANPTLAGRNCVSEFTHMRVSFGSPGGEPGLAFLCKDKSRETKPSASVPCAGGSARGGNQPPQMPTPTFTTAQYDPAPAWVPCDRVKLCGVAPLSTSVVGGNTNQFGTILNEYDLPADCTMDIRAVAVDASGNVQAAVGSPNALDESALTFTHPSIDPNPTAFLIRPTCGTACSPNGVWSAATNGTYPNTYYSCGGCP